VAQRVYLFLNMLFVLVVTHGGTIRAFQFLLEQWTLAELPARLDACRTPNCCIRPYRLDAHAARLLPAD
jgi:broad specificity phosphatase PhoE